MRANIAFLSMELSGYWIAGIEELSKSANVKVVHYPVNPEAPFKQGLNNDYLSKPENYKDLEKTVKDFSPAAIFVSGWADKDYLEIARNFVAKIPVVLCIDNPWEGNWRQWVNSISAIRLKRYFNQAWGCGPGQLKYLERLGFKGAKEGLYTADVELFRASFFPDAEKTNRIVCVARYIPQKNLERLWKAFSNLSEEFPTWELHCFGFGEGWDKRLKHKKIFHHGFAQPEALSQMVASSAAFVLPSLEEHWGVVVHEMAVCGLPLLLSENVEARHSFLKVGKNGLMFNPRDIKSIELCLRNFIELPIEQKNLMGQKSRELGLQYNPTMWAKTALSFLE